jgi:tetratricopeptide (TPR) repeat protein
MFLLVDSTGMIGNEARLREIFAEMAQARGADDRELNLRMAFWYSVFGRYEEAARALALAEPDEFGGGGLGASIVTFQALPAMLRVYRASGRAAEADELAQRYLARWRSERPQDPDEWDAASWTDLAALAASEGHRDEAVEALRQAMNQADLPYLFRPALPWFRDLEGHPGYDALVRERSERIARIKTEMLAIEAGEARGASQSQGRTR